MKIHLILKARQGLVQKKIQAKGKKGMYEQTVWVRADKKQKEKDYFSKVASTLTGDWKAYFDKIAQNPISDKAIVNKIKKRFPNVSTKAIAQKMGISSAEIGEQHK